VQLYDERLVFVGCDTSVGWEAIQQDRRAKVVGKYVSEVGKPSVFRAVIVFLKELEISGKVFSVSEQTDGLNLVIQPSGTAEATQLTSVFVPSNVPVFLEGDGEFPRSLLCKDREVRVVTDPAFATLTAKLVRITPETLEGEVQADDFYNRVLVVKPVVGEPAYVFVPSSATILDLSDGLCQTIDITAINPGDVVKCFGVPECQGVMSLNDFYGFIVLVTSRGNEGS